MLRENQRPVEFVIRVPEQSISKHHSGESSPLFLVVIPILTCVAGIFLLTSNGISVNEIFTNVEYMIFLGLASFIMDVLAFIGNKVFFEH